MSDKYEEGEIYRFFSYHPYRKDGDHNPDRDTNTFRIMDLKNPTARNHKSAVAHLGDLFAGGIDYMMEKIGISKVQLAIVPSSKKDKVSVGLEGVIGYTDAKEVLYNRKFLVRTQDIDSAHEGGIRSERQHLETIRVDVVPEPNIPLIIFDDVATTGTSLEACEKLIRESGVKEVYMLALGRTA
ncbi:hypothetical protein AB4648_24110 [Vibrio splendidus]